MLVADLDEHGGVNMTDDQHVGMGFLVVQAVWLREEAARLDLPPDRVRQIVDTLTFRPIEGWVLGLLVAASAMVQPDKKLASVKPESLKKKFKQKAFAANCDRELIMECETAGIPLDDFLALGLKAALRVERWPRYLAILILVAAAERWWPSATYRTPRRLNSFCMAATSFSSSTTKKMCRTPS